MAVLLIACHVLAHEQSPGDQIAGAKPALSEPTTDLADIVPSAAELAGRLVTLENGIKDGLEVKSELHQEIDRSFREAGIVIAFPQQDVHLDGTKPVEIRVVSEDLSTDKK